MIVADSNYLVRKGLAALIEENIDFTLLAEVSDKNELLEEMRICIPNIVVIDFSTEGFKLETLQLLNKKYSSVQLLAITTEISSSLMARALDSGLTSYVLNDCDKEEITEALYKTSSAERFLCGKIVERLMTLQLPSEKPPIPSMTSCDGLNITEREMEIIKLIAEGYSNKEIAEQLFLSTHTITTHRKNIMAKLKVNNTAGVVMFAVRENLLTPNKYLFSGAQ